MKVCYICRKKYNTLKDLYYIGKFKNESFLCNDCYKYIYIECSFDLIKINTNEFQ